MRMTAACCSRCSTDDALPDSLRDHREHAVAARRSLQADQRAARRARPQDAHRDFDPRRSTGDDATYAALEDKIDDITDRRNDIAGQMIDMLEEAAFHGQEIDKDEAEHLIDQAEDLLEFDRLTPRRRQPLRADKARTGPFQVGIPTESDDHFSECSGGEAILPEPPSNPAE